MTLSTKTLLGMASSFMAVQFRTTFAERSVQLAHSHSKPLSSSMLLSKKQRRRLACVDGANLFVQQMGKLFPQHCGIRRSLAENNASEFDIEGAIEEARKQNLDPTKIETGVIYDGAIFTFEPDDDGEIDIGDLKNVKSAQVDETTIIDADNLRDATHHIKIELHDQDPANNSLSDFIYTNTNRENIIKDALDKANNTHTTLDVDAGGKALVRLSTHSNPNNEVVFHFRDANADGIYTYDELVKVEGAEIDFGSLAKDYNFLHEQADGTLDGLQAAFVKNIYDQENLGHASDSNLVAGILGGAGALLVIGVITFIYCMRRTAEPIKG